MDRFSDWEPDEQLMRQIRSSLLRHIGFDSRRRRVKQKATKDDSSIRYEDELPKSTVDEDMAFQKAINESLKQFEHVSNKMSAFF